MNLCLKIQLINAKIHIWKYSLKKAKNGLNTLIPQHLNAENNRNPLCPSLKSLSS